MIPIYSKYTFYIAFVFLVALVIGSGCEKEESSDDVFPDPNDTIVANPDDTTLIDLEWGEPCNSGTVEFRKVDLGGVSLNVACKGEGPVIVMLHGFPEFWFGWNSIMDSLSKDYRLIIPDQRGYNLSDKPGDVASYEAEILTNDIAELIDKVSVEPILLVGHDWGGVIAWLVAHHYPELIKGLVIINAPHPDIFKRELANNPDQQAASSYITLFQSPLAESLLSANDYDLLFNTTKLSEILSSAEISVYKEAWSQPGALTSMLNWYRASYDNGNMSVGETVTISVPTLVLWGMEDFALLPGNLIGLDQYVADIEVNTFPNAGHFIVHELPSEVAFSVKEFALEQGYY